MEEELISGIPAGFLEGVRSETQVEGGQIHFNFAFDEKVFKEAYYLWLLASHGSDL
jgi:hypothetical protein